MAINLQLWRLVITGKLELFSGGKEGRHFEQTSQNCLSHTKRFVVLTLGAALAKFSSPRGKDRQIYLYVLKLVLQMHETNSYKKESCSVVKTFDLNNQCF